MASIWMRLDSVPTESFMEQVVVPLIKALGAHGVHANLETTRNSIFQNQGDLAYALYPGGELGFVFTTGPTFNPISGSTDYNRYMMASVTGVPADVGVTDADINQAISDFQMGLFEREIYDASPRITEGGSISGRSMTVSSGSAGSASSGSAQTKSGCYIATAVYGGYDLPQVIVLRRFRDEFLARSLAGKAFVRFYYGISPWLVNRVGARGWFTSLVRPFLDRLTTQLRDEGFSDAPYDDPRR